MNPAEAQNFEFTSEQKDKIKELTEKLRVSHKALLTAPTNWGKTLVYLVVALIFNLPITILVNTYEGVKPVIDALSKLNVLKNLAVFIPMGKDNIRKRFCGGLKCKECTKKRRGRFPSLRKKAFIGKIVDGEFVLKNYPEYCPYSWLKHYVNEGLADVVITHWKLFTDSSIHTEGFLIVDEVDKPLEPHSFPLVKYELAQGGLHLESSRTKSFLAELLRILDKMLENPPYSDRDEKEFFIRRVQTLQKIVRELKDWFPSIPNLEAESIDRSFKLKAPDVEVKPVETYRYGIQITSTLIKDKAEELKPIIRSYEKVDELNEFVNYDFIRLTPQERDAIYTFLHVIKNKPEIFCKQVLASPALDGKGYVEVHVITKSHELDRLIARYAKVLYVTATPPAYVSPEFEIVKVESDPTGCKKLVLLMRKKERKEAREEVKTLIVKLLPRFNIIGLASSYRRMKVAVKHFGGLTVGSHYGDETYDDYIGNVCEIVKTSKGHLYWTHYGSLSRATNDLGVFDGCVVHSWMARSPPHEVDKLEYTRKCVNELYQFVSRVFRTIDGQHRSRFCIMWEKKAFEQLKAMRPDWSYRVARSADDAYRIIVQHAEAAPLIRPVEVTVESEVVEKRQGPYSYLVAKVAPNLNLPRDHFKPGDKVRVTVKKLS